MNTRLQQQYLDAMGIVRWVPRRGADAGSTEKVINQAAPPNVSGSAIEPSLVFPASMESDGVPSAWKELESAVRTCTKCPLHATRTQTVFGVGNRNARWMFIGEAPGADEDRQGEPFVGRAGQLLNAMLFAMGLKRGDVYIANVLKCRPPGNRDPQPEEVAQCEPYLLRQIDLIHPALIVALGRHAAHSLLKTEAPLARLRGQRLSYHGAPLIVTYHPAYLLRNPADKRKAWDDLRLAKSIMDKCGRDAATPDLRMGKS
ncbi:MAG TPA: uracil-DNA glycosylase [Candidatus Methylomirabilis sp.]|nr:uracil-DNA glycosylase [Candidatus Methylomirabilis sp.]